MTNADKFKHYERWATASDFPTDNIVNDGSTDHADRLGSVADLALCLRAKKILEEGSSSQEVLVIAGDMIFQVCTGRMGWMAHRKWKEIKQQPGTAVPGNILGGCLVSLHFLYDIHSIHFVQFKE